MDRKTTKSLIGAFVGMTLVLSLVVGVGSAKALTASELLNLLIAAGVVAPDKVAAAQAALGATTVSVTSGYNFTKDLTIGAKGDDVTALQNLLIQGGYPISAGATGYFGAQTKAALVKFQLANGISPAAGYFGSITRAKIASMSATTTPVTPVTPVTGTDLKVTLAASSPAASAIIAGQAAADLAEFTFANTSATPAVITNVALARLGVSADTSLSNVYLYNGSTRLTDSATVSSGKITFNASNGLFTVPAGSTITVSVKADIAAGTNGQQVSVALTSVTSNVTLNASLPIAGASMSIFSSSDIAQATSTLTGNVTAATITVQAGTANQTIWSSNLALSGRAVYLKSLAVKVIGSIPTNSLQNVKLYVSGVQVASATGIDSNGMLTFDLTSAPYKIDSSRTIEVRADVVNGSSRSFTVALQNVADIQLIDSNYNVGIAVAFSGAQTTGSFAVSNGSVTVTQDTTLSSGNIVTGSSNAVLARYTFKAYGEDMKISYLQASTSHVGGLQNVALFANGLQIGSTQTIAAAAINTGKLFNIGSSLIIPAGTSVTVEIRADVKDADGTNATTTSATAANNQIVVAIAGYASNAQGSYSQALTTVPAVGGVNGPTMSVVSAGLTLAVNSAVASSNNVPNVSAAKIGSYVVQSSSAEAIRVTGLTVTLGGAAGAITNLSNLYVAVADSTPTTPINPQATNNFSVDFTVAANSSKVVDIYADLGPATGVASTTLALTGYGVSSNISVVKNAVYGQLITVNSGALSIPTLKTGSGYTPDAQLVVGETSSVIAYYNATSSNGASTIKEMYFLATGTSARNNDGTVNESPIVSVTVGGVTASVVSGLINVTGLNISVPQGYAGYNIPVTVTFAKVGDGGVVSNKTVGLTLTGLKYSSGNTETSTTTLAVTAYSNLMTLVSSKPTITIANPSDTTVGGSATAEIARITISADAKGPIEVNAIPLSLITTGSGAALTSASTTVKVGSSLIGTTDNFATAVGSTTAATGTITFNTPYSVAAGSSVTFSVYVDDLALTQVNTTVDTLRTKLGVNTLFSWNDVNGNVSPNGSAIYNYPTNSAVISH